MKTGGEAAELAHDFFTQSDAHVLLLSATPYKPFTYAEETAEGAGHYEDFLKTLEFLAASEGPLDALRSDLDALRQAALSGEPTAAIRDRVQARLRRWIARTERPAGARRTTTLDMTTRPFGVRAEDFSGWVALKRVADEVRGPLSVEYWKSSPYFLNFLSGYRVGERVRDHMKVPDRRARLMPLFRGAQRIARSDVEGFQPLEWANARMRALAAETLDAGLVAIALDAAVHSLPLARRPVRVGRAGRDHEAAHLLQLGGRSLGHRLPPELRGPAAHLRGLRAGREHARGPGRDLEPPRLPDGG